MSDITPVIEREAMEFDVVIVGAGPAGLSAACRLMQQAQASGQTLTVCVVEKGSEVGAHILSGAIIDPRALDELFPDWAAQGAPLHTTVTEDHLYLLHDAERARRIPDSLIPKSMHNQGNYIISLGNLCRWLAERAEALGVDIFPGFAAASVLWHQDGVLKGGVKGIVTGDMGVGHNGEHKASFTPGMELHAKYTLFTEGCRGHLGKQLIEKFSLDKDADSQHYGLGIKELWDIAPTKHQPGLVLHGAGWPLTGAGYKGSNGGFFLYHGDDNQVAVGLIIDLNYRNPWLSPFDEFQRMKQHPLFSQYLDGGQRVAYGARAICKGGFNSLPKMTMPGALLLGCDAGTLNFSRIKGIHTAMKSGMLAAETVFDALCQGDNGGQDLTAFSDSFRRSWLYDELFRSRNFGSAIHKLGTVVGGGFNVIDQNLFAGKIPMTLHDNHQDYSLLKPAAQCKQIEYPPPNNKLCFDKLSSVFLSNTNHEEDQPCHLQLKDSTIPLSINLPEWAEPAQRYCPAGVYEVITSEQGQRFQINAQNCIHCKTCDIKDPSQNITWVAPEGGGGPNYPNM